MNIEKYLRHLDGCSFLGAGGGIVCSCGLFEAIDHYKEGCKSDKLEGPEITFGVVYYSVKCKCGKHLGYIGGGGGGYGFNQPIGGTGIGTLQELTNKNTGE